MTTCKNCGSTHHNRRDPGIFRDTEVCENCGWWVRITPGTGLTVAAAVSAFVIGMFGPYLSGPEDDDLQPA